VCVSRSANFRRIANSTLVGGWYTFLAQPDLARTISQLGNYVRASGLVPNSRSFLHTLYASLESVFFVSFSGPCDPVHNPNSRPKQKENCCRERDGYNWKKIELVMKLFFSLGFVRIPVDQGHGEYGLLAISFPPHVLSMRSRMA
jgi:hypothetical protein